MKIRPLQDRVIVKRLEEEAEDQRAALSFPIPLKKSPWKVKLSPSVRERQQMTAS